MGSQIKKLVWSGCAILSAIFDALEHQSTLAEIITTTTITITLFTAIECLLWTAIVVTLISSLYNFAKTIRLYQFAYYFI